MWLPFLCLTKLCLNSVVEVNLKEATAFRECMINIVYIDG